MTGKQLYEHYRQAQLDINDCRTDEWDQLEEGDRAAWNTVGEKVEAFVDDARQDGYYQGQQGVDL